MAQLLDQDPGQGRGGGGNEGVQEGQRGQAVRFQVRTRVEAEPADPQQRGPDHGQRQAVWRHGFLVEAHTLADHDAADQARDPGVDVDHRATGKVQRTPAPEQAMIPRQIRQEVRSRPVPDHVRDRVVGQKRPADAEDDQRPELDAFRKGPDDQRRRDAGEGHLEDHEGVFRDVDVVREGRGIGAGSHARQHRLGQTADVGRPAGEGEAVADRHPHDRADRHDHQDLHQQRQHVLGADKPAVEQRQGRNGHHQHQDRADQHPGRVALVHHGRHLFDRGVLDRAVLRQRRQTGKHRDAKRPEACEFRLNGHVRCTPSPAAYSASSSVSPVRTRTACSTSRTKIFPSPILSVFAVFWMVVTT